MDNRCREPVCGVLSVIRVSPWALWVLLYFIVRFRGLIQRKVGLEIRERELKTIRGDL